MDTLIKIPHLYGLGVVENLKGEIIIFDGKTYTTEVDGKTLKTKNSFHVKAAMLVYQQVTSWKSYQVSNSIQNLEQLQSRLEEICKKQTGNLSNPLAFIIKARKAKVNYHVIDWQAGIVHNASNHKQFAKPGEIVDQEITILGFYSSQHQGIFTPHQTKIHLHMLTNDFAIVGHVDEMYLGNGFELLLPN